MRLYTLLLNIINKIKSISVDYIVEEGTDGDWSYVKWNSGIAEAWLRKNIGQVTVLNTLSDTIVSNTIRLLLPSELFSQVPTCLIDVETNDTGYCDKQITAGTPCTTTKAPGFRLSRIGSGSTTLNNVIIVCIAKGRWK